MDDLLRICLNEGIQILNDRKVPNEVQLLRVGTFNHNGQTVEVTKKMLKKMIVNFDENVRGIDLMLDWSHKSDEGAAAWFESLQLGDDGKQLWGTVSWTNKGEETVRDKDFRYISSDFHPNYIDNESGKEFGPTLFGAALTNRPVIKDMAPTMLDEHNPEEDKKRKLKKSEDDAMDKLKEELAVEKAKNKELNEKLEKQTKELSETSKKLEDNEAATKLAEENADKEKKLAEKGTDFDAKLKDGLVVEAQRDAYIKDDMVEFMKNQSKVNLSEAGSGKTPKNDDDLDKNSATPAQDKVLKLAEEKAKEAKEKDCTPYISEVLRENKELSEKYEAETSL